VLVWWWGALAGASPELCNGLDDDADGQVDEGPVVASTDEDGDGSGKDEIFTLVTDCSSLPDGAVSDLSDCDDGTEKIRPGEDESCDALDNDCDGFFDEGACPGEVGTEDDSAWMLVVADGYTWVEAAASCQELGWHLATPADDQQQEGLWTYAEPEDGVFWLGLTDREYEGQWAWIDGTEVGYDSWDYGEPNDSDYYGEDCGLLRGDGYWDDRHCDNTYGYACEQACTERWWHTDADGDGLGDPDDADDECERLPGTVANAMDCNDSDPDQPAIWYLDEDGDGYGTEPVVGCDVPGASSRGGDCDESAPSVHPGADELAGDGVDQNCDGSDIPVEDPASVDSDGDGIVDEIDPDPADPGGVASVRIPRPDPGCTCTQGREQGPAAWGSGVLLLLVRRRRVQR
jgi:hypothetical protein